MILTLLRRQRHSLFAIRDSTVPLTQAEIRATENIVRQCIVGRCLDLPVQRGDGLVNPPFRQQSGNGFILSGGRSRWCKVSEYSECNDASHNSSTTLTSKRSSAG